MSLLSTSSTSWLVSHPHLSVAIYSIGRKCLKVPGRPLSRNCGSRCLVVRDESLRASTETMPGGPAGAMNADAAFNTVPLLTNLQI